ncbi:MAG: class I SAM-dependent methyltransferase [Verrucomicrobiota bacterium]|jgi:SAM-dependent methyltransferase
MPDEVYHQTRFQSDPRRGVLWQTLVDHVFQKQIPPDAVVLELGAGYGEFINAVKARRRIAVDCWAGMTAHLAPGVEALITNAAHLGGVADNSVDYVFASNCFEHLTRAEFLACLGQLRQKMKPGAKLTIVQPNFKYCVHEYFDDYTHVSIYTHRSLCDLLESQNFRIERCVPRFLPLTIKSRAPVQPWLIRLYLASPVKPLGKQMLITAVR